MLLPCPFCGEAEYFSIYASDPFSQSWNVHCDSCFMSGPTAFNKEDAIRLWNKRKISLPSNDCIVRCLSCKKFGEAQEFQPNYVCRICGSENLIWSKKK